ncbi:MAG: hypothetical protein IJR54_01700 [Oscillibacter sp.]|nr:hypothetical protein [Oscillibacter sp.]
MAKKYGPITVTACARTRNGAPVDVDALDPERRRTLATELSLRILNEAYAGEGIRFFPAEDARITTDALS